jgi:hypothetical protein
MDDLCTAFQALAVALAHDGNPFDLVGPEATNIVAAYTHSIGKPSPAKTWWHLPYDHPAIARALRIDPSEPVARYALAPFRYVKRSDRHLILAAWPCPRQFSPITADWLEIEAVLAWEPATGAVHVLTDERPQLFGNVTEDDAVVFADPRAFFTEWARKRAWFASAYQAAMTSPWSAKPRETDRLPGGLIVGDPDSIHWPYQTMPQRFTTVGIDPKRVNRAILKSARLPLCTGTENTIARAA